jgi:3-methyladenine DNA glycosylase AlkD
MSSLQAARAELERLGNPVRAAASRRYFKTGPGEYGEGDLFLGVPVPDTRRLARRHRLAPLDEVTELLRSPVHEERLLALLIFVYAYPKADAARRRQIYDAYLGHTRLVNNWDLVDCSAPHVVGAHLFDRDRRPLYALAASPSLWERRIAIIATFHFIRREDYGDTLSLAARLLADKEDLIHKAVGWMLREVGNRDLKAETGFLRAHYKRMPRTMLRYAVERFPEGERLKYLRGEV